MAKFNDVETNERIRDREVRLIGVNGEQLGIISGYDARQRARELNLDVVKISPTAQPPVCKIMDYGKYKFDTQKREKEAKRNQKIVELKEIRLSMTIEKHDLDTKAKNAVRFLSAGDKVKVSLRMRGRQQSHKDIGVAVMQDFYEICKEVSVMEKQPTTEGRDILMILVPNTAKK